MFCSECGLQNSDTANFCSKCGTLLPKEEAQQQTTLAYAVDDVTSAVVEREAEGPVLVIRAGGGRAGEHLPLQAAHETIGRAPESGGAASPQAGPMGMEKSMTSQCPEQRSRV
mgnify:CR=1 FL=1